MSTFGDLKTAFAAKGYVVDTTAEGALRAGYRRVLSERRWPFLLETATLSTAFGQREVSLTSVTDLGSVDAVVLDDGSGDQHLDFVDAQQERRLNAEDSTPDLPLFWTLHGLASLRLWPVPDKAYTLSVDYVKDPADPANDAAVLVVPHRFIDIIVWAATAELAYRQRDWSAAQNAVALYERQMATMIRSLGMEQRSGRRKIAQSPFWDEAAR